MSQDTEYLKLYEDTLTNLPSMSEEILDYNTTSSFFKKLVNTTRSTEEKLNLLKDKTLNKELSIDGYEQGNIISMNDADSGIFIDAYGNQQSFRFADFNPIDAIDKEKARENSAYKKFLQPKLVSDLTGKSEETLTEEDYTNVSNYQFNEVFKSLNDNNYSFSPYDPNKNYAKENNNNPVSFAYKIVGEDAYGRKLIEAVNPSTGRQVSFDMSNNPYLNSSFNLYKSIDTESNKENLNAYTNATSGKFEEYIENLQDTDGRFGETLDMAQSNIYQSAARVLEKGPNWLVDVEKWKKIADYETGQQLADAWAGVKSSTRREYAKAHNEAVEQLKEGKYWEAIKTAASQFDRLLADSAAQMGAMIGTALITKGIANKAGASKTVANAVAALSGAMAAATDQTLISMKEYEHNNKKKMPLDKIAATWAGNVALLIPETIMVGLGLGNVIPKIFKTKLATAYKKPLTTVLTDSAKTVSKGLAFEGIQEMSQDTFNTYLTQDENNPRSIYDIATSPEILYSGIAGAIVGGGLSAGGVTLSNALSYKQNSNISKAVDEIRTQRANTSTTLGQSVDTTVSNDIRNSITDFISRKDTLDDTSFINEVRTIQDNLNSATGIDQQTDYDSRKLMNSVLRDKLMSFNSIEESTKFANLLEKNLGLNKNKILTDAIYFSDLNAEELLISEGKVLTEEGKENATNDLVKLGESLGFTKDEVIKYIKEVNEEVKYGPKGYMTYLDEIESLDKSLTDTSLSEEDRNRLTTQKESTIEKLLYFYRSQLNKAEQITAATQSIAQGNTRNATVEYASKKGKFTVHSSNLVSGNFDKGTGVYELMRSISEGLNTMSKVRNYLTEEQAKDFDTLTNIANNTIQEFKDASNRVKIRGREEAKSKVSTLTQDNIKSQAKVWINNLHKLSKLEDSNSVRTKQTKLFSNLQNVDVQVLEEIKTDITNSNKLSDKDRVSLLETVDKVINQKVSTDKAEVDLKNKRDANVTSARDILNNYDDSSLESIKNIKELNNILETLGNTYLSLKNTNFDEETETLLKNIEEKARKVTNRITTLEKENKPVIKEVGINKHKITSAKTDRSSLKNAPARATKDGILLANDITKKDVFITKDIKDKLNSYGIDYDTLINTLEDNQVEDFILLHEYRYTQQIEKAGSHSSFMELYKVDLIKYETDAMLFALYEAGLINKNTFRKALLDLKNPSDATILSDSELAEVSDKGSVNNEIEDNTVLEEEIIDTNIEETTVSNYEEESNNINDNKDNPILKVLKGIAEDATISTNTSTVEEITKSATSREILDKNNNPSAQISYFGNTYYLANEVTVSNNPSSTLAINGLGKIYSNKIKNILKIAEKIKFNPNIDTQGKTILKPFTYLFGWSKKESKLQSNFNRAPHLPILYKMRIKNNKGKQEIDVQYNELTLAAVDLTVKQFFSTISSEDVFPQSRSSIARIFGIQEDTIKRSELTQLRKVVKEYGVPRVIMNYKLGKAILDNLGLKANKENSISEYNIERIATGLGMFALDYAEQLGLIEKTEFKAPDNHILKNDLQCVKQGNTKARINATNEYLGPIIDYKKKKRDTSKSLKSVYVLQDTTRTPISTAPLEDKNSRTVKGTDQKVPYLINKVLNKLSKQPYTILLDIVDFLQETDSDTKQTFGELLLAKLGVKEDAEISDLGYDEQLSAEGEKLSLIAQLQELFNYAAYQRENGTDFYFNFYQGKNSRIYLDSNTINPQTSKNIARFICVPKKMERTYVHNDPSIKIKESFAIAQAFDSISTNEEMNKLNDNLSNLTKEELLKMREDLIRLDESSFIKKYNNLGIKGIENYSQCLVVFKHLLAKIESNGKEFKTYLATENDSTTSGYFIKLLQFPIPRILSNFMNQVGIMDATDSLASSINSIHDFKMSNLDIYQTIAIKVAELLDLKVNLNNIKEELKNTVNKLNKEYETLNKSQIVVLDTNTNTATIKIARKDLNNFLEEYSEVEEISFNGDKFIIEKVSFNDRKTRSNFIIRKNGDIYSNVETFSAYRKMSITVDNNLEEVSKVFNYAYENWRKKNSSNAIKYLEKEKKELLSIMDSNIDPYKLENIWYKVRMTYAKEFSFLSDDNITDQMKKSLELMWKALPRPVEGSVSKALRSLMKNPTMVFGYTAGMKSISTSLAEEIEVEFINEYISIMNKGGLDNYLKDITDNDKKEKIKAIYYSMDNINKLVKGKNLFQQLKTKSSAEIWLKIGNRNMTLDTYFYRLLAPTYGVAVWQVLEKEFKEFIDINNRMNQIASTMYTIWSKVYKEGYTQLTKGNTDYFRGIPFSIKKKLLQYTTRVFPSIDTGINNGIKDGLALLSSSRVNYNKDLPFNIGVTNYSTKNGKTEAESANAVIFDYTDAGKGGAVLPIHTDDAIGMALSQFRHDDMTSIFDAEVASAFVNDERAKEYNNDMFVINKNMNIFDNFVNALTRVIDNYEYIRKHDLPSLPPIEEVEATDSFNKTMYNPITEETKKVLELLEEVKKLNNDIKEVRQKFYEKSYIIYNMDGSESAVTVDKNSKSGTKYFSGPWNTKSTSEVLEQIQDANVDVHARVSLIDTLQELSKTLGNKVASKEHIKHLKDLVSRITPENIKDIIVNVAKDRPFNYGRIEDNKIVIALDGKTGNNLDSITRLSPYSDKSAAEIYVHELIHGSITYAENTMDIHKLKSIFSQIAEIQKAAASLYTYEIFMPKKGTYDPKLENVYKKIAMKIYDYINNNNDVDNYRGLKEFIAYGLTNENLMNILKNNNLVLVEPNTKIRLLDRLVLLTRTIFNVIFGNDRPERIIDALKGSNISRNTLYKELEILTNKMIATNYKAKNKLLTHPLRILEYILGGASRFRNWGNSKISPKLQKFFNKRDMVDPYKFVVPVTGTMYSDIAEFFKILSGILTSSTRRKALIQSIAALTRATQEGLLLTTVRNMSVRDAQTSRLELLSNYTRLMERQSKALESTVRIDLESKFSKDLTDSEKQSLTKSCLMTDLQCLLNKDNSNIDYIKKVLSDDTFRENEINSILEELKKDKNYLYYRNQALGLARLMVTGKSNEAQNMNALTIVNSILGDKDINNNINTLVNNVDKLSTLYALSIMDANTRELTSTLENNGLLNYLISHKTFVKDSIINTENNYTHMKGYYKQLIDSSFDLKIALINNTEELKMEDYDLIGTIGNSKVTPNVPKLGLYRRSFVNPERRDGAGFVLSGVNTFKTTLKDTAYDLATNTNINTPTQLWNVFKSNADKFNKRLNKIMRKKEMTLEDFDKYSGNYSPIKNAVDGSIIDYRINIPTENRINELGMDIDGFSVLSKMYASQNTKISADTRNKAIIEFIRNDVKTHMSTSTLRNEEGVRYIRLHKNLNNKFFQKAWPVLPKILKEEINKGDFYVREDWLLDLFGTPSISINDIGFIKNRANIKVKRAIALAEYILKSLSYLTKQKIVLLIPQVLISNIISNFNLSIMSHSNFIKVFRMSLNNAKALREYLNDESTLRLLELRKRMGTATKEELRSINWYKARLENNIIAPLMKKGMFQSIVEDLREEEMDSIGKMNKIIKNIKILNKIPNAIKLTLKQLNMGEGTPIHDFMFIATQYSDFVARATEYQLQMEKAPKKYIIKKENGINTRVINNAYIHYEEKVTMDIWHSFINYNKPNSSIEQYANDIGLVLFTKFATRIQPVIFTKAIQNPIGVLMFLLGQYAVHDSEDIMEQNIINKDWLALFHSPLDNFVSGTVPMPLQYWFGIGTQN